MSKSTISSLCQLTVLIVQEFNVPLSAVHGTVFERLSGPDGQGTLYSRLSDIVEKKKTGSITYNTITKAILPAARTRVSGVSVVSISFSN
jgi:hypothetical protein